MARKFYVDTAIWRDYFEDRSDGMRPLGDLAFQFLKICRKKKYVVLVSAEVANELLVFYPQSRVDEIFSNFRDIIVHIEISKEQFSEAHSLWLKKHSGFPFSDVMHSILARDNCATIISRDRHFAEIGIADCLLPEEAD